MRELPLGGVPSWPIKVPLQRQADFFPCCELAQNLLPDEGRGQTIVPSLAEKGDVLTQELRDEACALGLDNLTDEHLAQFERARTGIKRLLQRVPRNVPPSHEPAHIYRAKGEVS
jgi:hypothetical protein